MTTSIKMKILKGQLTRKNESWEEARKQLQITESHYQSPETLGKSMGLTSIYNAKFDKGADIYPRSLWFVRIKKHELLGISQENPHVQTDESIKGKPPWDSVRISGTVEHKFLFSTILGEDLIPFGTLRFKPIVLPILVTQHGISIIEGSNRARSLGYTGLAEYLTNVEEVWKKLAKSKKLGLYAWIDFRRKLSSQKPLGGYKVIYTGSATHLTSTLIDQSQEFTISLDGTVFHLGSFIAESKVYYMETEDKDEALYLTSVLNSTVVDEAIKPMQTRGLFGARDIHKRPLKLPIPKYDSDQPTHRELARLGDRTSGLVKNNIAKFEKYSSIGKIRSSMRSLIIDELSQINEVVTELLSQSTKSN